jgi:ankyrin repeat protein
MEKSLTITFFIGADPNIKGDLNCPIITNAIRSKHVKIVKLLVNHNANICLCDDIGRTPIFHAMKIENLEIIKILLNTGIQSVIDEAKSYNRNYKCFLRDSQRF